MWFDLLKCHHFLFFTVTKNQKAIWVLELLSSSQRKRFWIIGPLIFVEESTNIKERIIIFPKDEWVLQKENESLMPLHLISLSLFTLQITKIWNINTFRDYKTCIRIYEDRKTKWKRCTRFLKCIGKFCFEISWHKSFSQFFYLKIFWGPFLLDFENIITLIHERHNSWQK